LRADPLGPVAYKQLGVHLEVVEDLGVVEGSHLYTRLHTLAKAWRIPLGLGQAYLDDALAGKGRTLTPHGRATVAAAQNRSGHWFATLPLR
jgi:hypothetical protein